RDLAERGIDRLQEHLPVAIARAGLLGRGGGVRGGVRGGLHLAGALPRFVYLRAAAARECEREQGCGEHRPEGEQGAGAHVLTLIYAPWPRAVRSGAIHGPGARSAGWGPRWADAPPARLRLDRHRRRWRGGS